jgi:hypothetical protein
MRVILSLFALTTILLSGCSKKSADPPIPTVPERLEVTPAATSIKVGETASFSLKFFDMFGKEATTLPAAITWSSANTAIATVNQQGIATAVSPGQVEIKAIYKNTMVVALLTVVANNTQIATITIEPAIKEIKLNDIGSLVAVAKNNAGVVVPGATFAWISDNTSLVDINTSTGAVTGKAYGTANVVASANGIQSAPSMVQVIRIGTFSGSGSTGSAKLKIENGVLKLQTSADFSASTGAPDLRIYLGNVTNSIANAVEVASLNQRNGVQSWNVATGITITQYRYVFIWCKQFGGNYGTADLGQ